MNTKDNIIILFDQQKELTVKEITEQTGSSKQMVHIALRQLLSERRLEKMGRTPKTFYRAAPDGAGRKINSPEITTAETALLRKHFAHVAPGGYFMQGIEGLTAWCLKRGLDPQKELKAFADTRSAYEQYYNGSGSINGISKLKNTKGYDKVHLDHLVYFDFYAIERFGKTRLGTLLHYAKQGQDKILMRILMDEIREPFLDTIREYQPDAIAYIPPTIPRETQFIRYMQNDLGLSLPVIGIRKAGGMLAIPQRSLQQLEERINNAEKTFIVTEKRKFRHVMLIDDEVNSGATLNQIAGKIRAKGVANQVSALSIVGQARGFEALTEMKVIA